MRRIAVEKAMDRLEAAHHALASIRASNGFQDFKPAWTNFLIALNSIHSILDTGKRGSQKSEVWFGRKKGERKKEKLLSYLHHARNADEHGIEEVVKHHPGGVGIGLPGETVHIISASAGPGGFQAVLGPVAGRYPTVTSFSPHPQLITVADRGVEYDPPNEHLGQTLQDNSAIAIAELGFTYHRHLIEEAKAIIC